MDDDLLNYLDTLSRGDCYRVDALLKDSAQEVTERVYLIAANGSERGPYIRKRIALDSGLGEAYERLWQAQRAGKRFMHLPSILECTVEDGQRCVVMEYVEGLTLDEAASAFDHSPQTAATVAVLLCDAVMELHESFTPPLIHRDLKPANVIVSESNLTLIDFGIARTYDADATTDTRSFGTRGYAPPEQFGYGQTDERSDIYALGMLMAYAFLGEEPSRALMDVGYDDERIPEAMRSVLAKATAFDPSARYKNARELKDDPAMVRLLDEVFADEETTDALEESVAQPASKEGPPVPPTAPPPPVAPETPPAVASKLGLSSRIPRWLGAVWNALIVAFWALLVVAAVSLTLFPSEGETIGSPALRAICYGGICVVGLGLVGYGIMDRRRLRNRFPALRRFPWYGETAICILAGFAVILLSVILTACLNPLFS